ncbi:tyrosine-type recombinase/integrase [Roseinatronobacter bogoriensis]|uniref:tyrosine-type recombinase/integrase n=1 Tax=Roseinatronobacter bogoriensis TaxID=119542 RepID=UPI001FD060D5|nr:tyrosine-type recombinase/integrase [Rhodobaca barguzinensis]
MYLPGEYGSIEFRQAYETCVQGVQKIPSVDATKPGTLNWLIVRYLTSTRYADLSEVRKKTLRRELEWLRLQAGDLPFASFEPRHVEALMARKEGPTAANTVKKSMSMLFNFAIKKSLMGQRFNPASSADRRKENPDGYHTWTEEEIAQYLAFHPSGSKPRLAMLIFLYTGASRQDAARMGRQNMSGERIKCSRGKTKVGADLPILPELADEIARLPVDQLMFLTHTAGKPYKPETLGNWFRDQCNAAGLPHCAAHGLRKAGATRLAEAGATEWEIASYLAHKDTKMAAVYVRKANRGKLADRGMGRLSQSKR